MRSRRSEAAGRDKFDTLSKQGCPLREIFTSLKNRVQVHFRSNVFIIHCSLSLIYFNRFSLLQTMVVFSHISLVVYSIMA